MSVGRRLESVRRILFTNKMTKPCKLGSKILFLATAPCVQDYFDYPSVREQFKDYDLACINYMIEHSQKEIFEWKPKYFMLFDPIFYSGSRDSESVDYNPEKDKVSSILNRIDWECYVVTSVLADFELINPKVKFIYISCLEKSYKPYLFSLYKRNLINMGIYNVVQGALYFAITFGYEDISILGCTYRNLPAEMTEQGLRVLDHTHYYNLNREENIIDFSQIAKYKNGFMVDLYERAVRSHTCFWNLRRYAEKFGAKITNYSEGSMIDAFCVGILDKEA